MHNLMLKMHFIFPSKVNMIFLIAIKLYTFFIYCFDYHSYTYTYLRKTLTMMIKSIVRIITAKKLCLLIFIECYEIKT